MKKFLLAAFLALPFGQAAHADELKVAVVDSAQAFDAFYKTQVMAKDIATKKANFEKEIQDMRSEYDGAKQQADSLAQKAQDTSLPMETRKDDDAELAQKMQEIKTIEGEIEQMRQSRSQEIQSEINNGHRAISDEIAKVIADYVAAQGFDLVLDKAASVSTAGSITFFRSEKIIDLTPEVIARLNASAPAH
jgi:Skp family chaperone for outer membrane proteins